ncbi:hypothetical protein [Bradyrhizobium sp.]|uniref:hypothetical protein n=1 Tax=Bradyrhizobium sp. TaxID=376 RepID=UPI003C785BEB
MRQNNTTGKSAKPVQTSAQKYSAFGVGQITDLNPRVSPDERGVAHVTNARWDAVDAALAHDERKRLADGEVVWSWRPDAGAKLCEDIAERRWQESPFTEESAK